MKNQSNNPKKKKVSPFEEQEEDIIDEVALQDLRETWQYTESKNPYFDD